MISEEKSNDNWRGHGLRWLPWLVALAALVLYGLTLNDWITLTSLPVVAKVEGWDWNTTISAPLLFITTYPFRWLPGGIQPVALNFYSAVCAALVLALLARTVILLPQDRTREQRLRERREGGWPMPWLPAVLACLVCGLQLSFWEHATDMTGDMLNLLLFAYVIRCLMEFRRSHEDRWLYRMALVYGMAIPNSYALIGYFPLFFVATVWIAGTRVFRFSFMMRAMGLGIAGLMLYILVPVVELAKGHTDATFWTLLRTQWGAQKSLLLFGPLRSRALVLSFTSIVPLAFAGIRWASSFGDMSRAGAMVTALMFRIIHAFFLAACLFVAFDPAYSPRQLGYGLPFLTFYYLGALAVGYYSGYFLVVGGVEPEKRWRRPTPGQRAFNKAILGVLVILLVAVPVGLVAKNWSMVQAPISAMVRDYARRAAEHIPTSDCVVISDNRQLLLLAVAGMAEQDRDSMPVLVESKNLRWKSYNDRMRDRYGDRWHHVDLESDAQPFDSLTQIEILSDFNERAALYYLEFSFGEYFEQFYQVPAGIVYRFKEFEVDDFRLPDLDDATISGNREFWDSFSQERERLKGLIDREQLDAVSLGFYYSRALNYWGVLLQRNGKVEAAAPYFTEARRLNEENLAAEVNALYNAKLAAGESGTMMLPDEIETRMQQRYRNNWQQLLQECGPVDEPTFCFSLGNVFAQGSLDRQAAQQYARAWELDPSFSAAGIRLAGVYLKRGLFDPVIELTEKLRADPHELSVTNRLQVVRLQAWAHYGKGDFEKAAGLLREAHREYPDFPDQLYGLARMYRLREENEEALGVLNELLDRLPNNLRALQLKARILMDEKDYETALEVLNRILKVSPKNQVAVAQRGLVYYEMGRMDEAEEDYRQLLDWSPQLPMAHRQMARIARQKGNIAQAEKHLEKLLELLPAKASGRKEAEEELRSLRQSAP